MADKPPRPASVTFFPNGTACVGDQYDRQMGRYQIGRHADTIAALAEDGYDWRTLDVWGSPQTVDKKPPANTADYHKRPPISDEQRSNVQQLARQDGKSAALDRLATPAGVDAGSSPVLARSSEGT